MQIYKEDFDAVIFDMDGTMVDNVYYHFLAWQELCRKRGIKLTRQEYNNKLSGRKNNDSLKIVFGSDLSSEEKVKLAEEKETLYRKFYKPHIKEIAGLTKFLKNLKSSGVLCAIATTAPLKNRQFVVKNLSIEKYFDLILGEEDVIRGKPFPDMYLKAAELLKVNPSRCLVFEDSLAGIEAAKSAGSHVIALRTSHKASEVIRADGNIKNFLQITLKIKRKV